MAAEEFFLTSHPEPRKHGVYIEKAKYNIVRNAILETLRAYGALSSTRLGNLLEEQLMKNFDGPVLWYYTTVKLDLEARGEIRCTPYPESQLVELARV